MNYENGLTKLAKYVKEYFEKSKDSQLRDEFDLHKGKLRYFLQEKNDYGPSDGLTNQIFRVTAQLNTIARELNIGMTFDDLCVQSDAPKPISNTRLEELSSLLKAFSLPDDDKLKALYDKYVPPNTSAPQNYQISGLLNCLAKMPQLSTGHVPMLDFLVRLMPYANNPKARNDLKAWIREVGKHLTLTETQIDGLLNNNIPQRKTTVPLHLLIELEPELDDNFIVSAWRVKSPEDIKNISLYDDKTFTLDDMPKLIDELLDEIHDALIAIEEPLTIEFFLPKHLLCYDVAFWTPEDDYPIGVDYQVVIRSRERLIEKKLQRRWYRYWNHCKGVLQNEPKTCVAWLDKPQKTLLSKLDDGFIFFILTFVPQPDFVFSLIRAGVPIALWSRQANQEIHKEFNALLSSCHQLEQLPESVRKERRTTWETKQHSGQISLLWDDPNRLPLKQLECPTQY
jgi:hypothetical protein